MNLAIHQLIKDQAFQFIIMLWAGMIIMIFYDIFTFIKNKRKPGKGISFIQDILFWVFASLLTSSFLYYSSYGQLSVHEFIAFGVGAILWKRFFCGIIKVR
ncbi:MAG: spore cortex biosynthesis protein YabQ [Anaerovoracaceae bacterium]|jgi:spore cortex biosynthesis protein YabQ